ncbi:hypothetical protein Bca4012_094495 [Brassica carinata]
MCFPAAMVPSHSDILRLSDVGRKEEWASFVRAKALRAGDTVVFVSVLGSAITHFATSRAHSQSWVRHSINLHAFSKAIGSLMHSKPVVWMCGMRVKKVREYDGENHVGTITSTTFGNSDVPGVMRTLWRCHTVVWDAPYGFDRIHFSPWEVTPSQEQPQPQPQPPHTLHLFP